MTLGRNDRGLPGSIDVERQNIELGEKLLGPLNLTSSSEMGASKDLGCTGCRGRQNLVAAFKLHHFL